MSETSWVLSSIERDVHVERFKIDDDDVKGTPKGWSVRKRTLRGGRREGVELIEINNGAVEIAVVPSRGMGIRDVVAGDERLGWHAPIQGPVHPRDVDLGEPSGLGWLDGFDELLVRCGLESNGAPEFDEQGRLLYPLHGKIANQPADEVTVAVDRRRGEIRISGVVDEIRFHFLKVRMVSTLVTRFGESGFRVEDEVENLSASPAEIQMLYHFNVGAPLLDAGSQLVAPSSEVVPRNDHAAKDVESYANYQGEEAGYEEQVYFHRMNTAGDGRARVLLKNAHSSAGVSLLYDAQKLPCFSQWKNTTAVVDGYVTGIEPGTNFPNPRTYEGKQGRVIKLPGGARTTLGLGVEWHRDAASVSAAEMAVAKMKAGRETKVYPKPQKGWCDDA
ncbi:MAG: aldose 1-epimerase family protein [Planctomycetota bacterium]|nr:aldose 1-epimerase family protein [Planctomycetota bacterium]